uniref:hypothetical protein n=1 Tax=Mycobacterium persicum TaxID=1487726 RepID=UPI001C3E1C45
VQPGGFRPEHQHIAADVAGLAVGSRSATPLNLGADREIDDATRRDGVVQFTFGPRGGVLHGHIGSLHT